MIEHGLDECTGTWTLIGGFVVCDGCGRVYPATPEARVAATDENCLDIMLRRAAESGAQLLARDSQR
jgi:hypothetical protein